MNIARQDHSGCALGDSLYVFGGACIIGRLNSIEKMVNVHAVISANSSKTSQWHLLNIAEANLPSKRYHSIVTPLDRTRILILGGRFNASWREIKSDAFVVDTAKEPSDDGYIS